MLATIHCVQSRCLTSFLPFSKLNQQFCKNYAQLKVLLNMNEAYLKYKEGNENFQISFLYVDPNMHLNRQFNFVRNVNETISNFTNRLNKNISNYAIKNVKRKSKKKCSDEETINNALDSFVNKPTKIMRNNSVLDGDLTCKSILEDVSNTKLIIFGIEYTLRRNIPCISKIALPSCILAGFPTYPSKFESEFVDISKSIFSWYKVVDCIGNKYIYVPNSCDVGYKLEIRCTPINDTEVGPQVAFLSNNTVEAGPGPCPFELRHAFTESKLSGKRFRVVSYNILANVYSETSLSKDVLYPYCTPSTLSMDYRKLLILKELLGYNADIICLQEVENNVYKNDLMPCLRTQNYDGVLNLKNDTQEGVAIFYNQKRFDKLSSDYSIISQNTDLSGFNATWSQIQNENVKKTFTNRNTIVQVLVLKSKENPEILVIGNTHLYFLPIADHIRLLQAYYGLMYLQKFAKETKEKYPEHNVSILFCGDFNSVPENGIYQLMTQSYIPEDYADWRANPNECVENVSLKHDLKLSSACGTPEYTNYTGTFQACLDYIFYQTDYLGVQQVIPMPSKDELTLHTGLPSVVFPSDHISLCTDLKWLK